MRRFPLALALLISTTCFAQQLPPCAKLSDLWLGRYKSLLKPSWQVVPLACGKNESQLSAEELRDLVTARAAYVLDRTEFTSRSFPADPIVPGGGIEAPPDSMLEWVGDRITQLYYDPQPVGAATDQEHRIIHLGSDQFPLQSGLGLAGQLIHEARHAGFPMYGHVRCGYIGGYDRDSTITEEFHGGGSHGIAALWSSWVAMRSTWNAKDREELKGVVVWVMMDRINAPWEVRNAFTQRYLGLALTKDS